MADMDYDREISPKGAREGSRKSPRERKKESEGGKQTRATQDLEINVVPLALGIINDCVNAYCRGGMVLIFRVLKT